MLEPDTPIEKSNRTLLSTLDSPPPKCCREKLVFCIDLDISMDENFMTGEKSQDSRISRSKQLLKWFIGQKSRWNPKHEFAMMVLGTKALWHMDFTSESDLISHVIDELYTMGKFDSFDYTSILRELVEHVDLDEDDDSIIRVIMIYTRSNVLPTSPDNELREAFYASRKFRFDCIYIHNRPSEVEGPITPQHIYDRLIEFEDVRHPSYFYEMTRALKKFATAMSELLMHPDIRPLQDEKIEFMMPPPSVQEEEQRQAQSSQSTNAQPVSSEQRQVQQQQRTQHIQQHKPQQQPHVPTALKQPPVSKDTRPTQSDLVPFGTQPFSAGGVGGMNTPMKPSQSSFYGSPPSSSSSPLNSYGISSRTPPPPPSAGPIREFTASPIRKASPAHQLSPAVDSIIPVEITETKGATESKMEL
ncbi:BRISC and BRCA1-A complex member 1 [Entomortierella parvispora]|uniref:BRISC and BRCA1-A complex member 1 n=1 Tax=Entomortierella parvispora TaxID=205924 RepID=A0A9P3LYW4_9FUNG|nr:BRISC and BRCA1-A complex member 1 [Entomortierella parvispora]